MQAPTPTLTPQTQPTTQAPGQPAADPAYGPAVGLSLKEKEQVRQLEGIAAEKTARDYQHIVLAYGVLWALFAGYGIFLWRRSARLRADMDDLRRTLDRRP
ncbi:MAG TPA: hypothetical protein VGB85_15515 [Nannocystis sp.]|jgi:hypothetical protein